MSEQRPALDRLMQWLQEIIPWSLNVGLIVYNYLVAKARQMELLKQRVELENEKLKNKIEVEDALKNKSSADIIRDAANEGKRGRPSD